MATYTLMFLIDSKIVKLQSRDNFNIARKVNNQYTVTFDGASINPIGTQKALLGRNEFRWTEEYSAFLSTSFDKGMQTKADDSLFDESNKSNSFVLKSVPQTLQASVACKSGGKWVPIYVDNKQHQGVQNKQLTPVNKYAIFWDSRIVTSTMIDYSKTTNPKEFSFAAGETTKTIRWGYASPNAPSSTTEVPDWYIQ